MIEDVIAFWEDAGPAKWFIKDEAFDRDFRDRFLDLHHQAARRERDDWAQTARGSLALMILLDQFPRNAFRGTAHMFATDPLALRFARQAVAAGQDMEVDETLRPFLYLPFEHSEDLADQARAVALMQPLGGESLRYAEVHLEIIQRFGRFPHRNPALGRDTTPEEAAFIAEGGFAG